MVAHSDAAAVCQRSSHIGIVLVVVVCSVTVVHMSLSVVSVSVVVDADVGHQMVDTCSMTTHLMELSASHHNHHHLHHSHDC